MRELLEKCLLLLYCLFAVCFHAMDSTFIVGLFLSISLSSLFYVLSSPTCRMIFFLVYLLLSLLFPGFTLFLPLLVWDMAADESWWPIILSTLCVCLFYLIDYPKLILFLLLGGLISCYLSRQQMALEQMEALYKTTRDDSRERTLLLSQRNQDLIQHQNQQIYTATLKERNRIAREIHDSVGHMLSRSILMVGALKAVDQSPQLKEPLENLDSTLNHAMDSIRQSVHDLHDDSINLEESIKGLIGGFTFCPVSFTFDMSQSVPRAVKYAFISITQEAMGNVIRHSDATCLSITMREHPGLYQLIIQDNGTKAVPDTSGSQPTLGTASMGLGNMRDRVHALQGNIQFQQKDGFSIYIIIPKHTEESL